jgi:hypothetical protein
MLNLWLEAVEDLLISAPGNATVGAGELWDSTLTRLGESDETTAKADRVAFDLFEDADLEPKRPFFVLQAVEATWHTPGSNAFCGGAVDVFYTEQAVDPSHVGQPVGDGAAHKRSQQYFAAWVGELMQWCAGQINASGVAVKISAIRMVVPPMRTPKELRDRDRPESDYWWTAWRFEIGESG